MKAERFEVDVLVIGGGAAGCAAALEAKATVLASARTNRLSRRATGTREMRTNGLAMAARAGIDSAFRLTPRAPPHRHQRDDPDVRP